MSMRLLRLFGGRPRLAALLAAGARDLGYTARLAFAPTPAAALAFARAGLVGTALLFLALFVSVVMGIGAVFGAFNTMYSSLASRTKEIATLRAIGFSSMDVILAMLFEALLLALAGGVTGALLAWPLNGFTANTLNFQSFSQMAFAFQITPKLMLEGIVFAVIMGLAGGIVPALRAARMKPADALREI